MSFDRLFFFFSFQNCSGGCVEKYIINGPLAKRRRESLSKSFKCQIGIQTIFYNQIRKKILKKEIED